MRAEPIVDPYTLESKSIAINHVGGDVSWGQCVYFAIHDAWPGRRFCEYVGVTSDFSKRIRQHNRNGSPFLHEITCVEVYKFSTRLQALASESIAISLINPPGNKARPFVASGSYTTAEFMVYIQHLIEFTEEGCQMEDEEERRAVHHQSQYSRRIEDDLSYGYGVRP